MHRNHHPSKQTVAATCATLLALACLNCSVSAAPAAAPKPPVAPTSAPAAASAAASATPAPIDPAAVLSRAVERGERLWKSLDNPPPTLSAREIFSYALALAETKTHLDRLEKLFDTAARMHDTDPASRTYGNFRWSWKDEKVLDQNAVEFSMMAGSLLWLRHRDTLPPPAREKLKRLLDLSVEGCMRRRVSPSYTNIAIMNAGNLIILGETMGLPKAADEGYARLGRILMNTYENGITEYGSPSYYGVDIECLRLIEAFAARDIGRQQARTMLELFWTDIALNYFPPSQRLGGPHSRDYQYMLGRGGIEPVLTTAGWMQGGAPPTIFCVLGRWQPPASLLEMSRTRFPRLVVQSWGPQTNQWRMQYLLPDVTLGSAGAIYHNMDLPLTVDLPGGLDMPRCYFIPDARHDPYGKAKIPEGSGAHEKTLHLKPFWAAAQRKTDALGLVLYRDEDQTRVAKTLESHFVLPRAVDGFWVGDERIAIKEGTPLTVPVKPGAALVLRKGTAAVGVRVPWARAAGGKDAPAAFVYDGNKFGVVRLTVTHYESADVLPAVAGAGAAFWVRIGSGLTSDTAFDAWRKQFAVAKADAATTADKLTVRAAGGDGPLAIEATYPAIDTAVETPTPARAVLALDGTDIGRAMLVQIEPVKTEVSPLPGVTLAAGKGVYVEAESGRIAPVMEAADDPAASGGKFVWVPGKPGEGGRVSGRVRWDLTVPAAGNYYIWGRVQSPTPSDDSFTIALTPDGGQEIRIDWSVGKHPQWGWSMLTEPGAKSPRPFALPAGKVRLELAPREDGAKMDRLFITGSAADKPQ